MIEYILICLISYLLGSIPTALLYVKAVTGIDLRKVGSKNTGALNTLRIISKEKGKAAGVLGFLFVFLLDGGKAVFSGLLAIKILAPDPQNYVIALTLATFFAVLGHNYSIFLKFKGGRGAASLIGVLLWFDFKAFLAWMGTIILFMIVFEIFLRKEKTQSLIKNAVSDQIIGRLIGEIVAVISIYIFSPMLFWPTLAATPLILIRHKKRLTDQIKSLKR